VHPTGGSRRVFEQFSWLGVGSVKMALSRPTHQRVPITCSVKVFQESRIKSSLCCSRESFFSRGIFYPVVLFFLGNVSLRRHGDASPPPTASFCAGVLSSLVSFTLQSSAGHAKFSHAHEHFCSRCDPPWNFATYKSCEIGLYTQAHQCIFGELFVGQSLACIFR